MTDFLMPNVAEEGDFGKASPRPVGPSRVVADGLELDGLADAQARAVADRQKSACLQVVDHRDEPSRFFGAQDLVPSSTTVRHLSCWPLAAWSNTKS